jgi:GNAT superfamily N-acetyltransferase
VIRDYEDRDAEAGAALIVEYSPWLATPEGLRHRLRALPERAHRKTWVAEVDGGVVAWGEAEFDWVAERDDIGTVWVVVASDHRGRGLGSALFERTTAHMEEHGAGELRTWSIPAGESCLERRGFRRAREERISAVDPRTVDTSRLDDLPAGVDIVPLAALLDRLPELHALYSEAAADMPADHAESNIPYDEWVEETVGNPDLDRDASMVVLVEGRPAALSWLEVYRAQRIAQHDLTGTARAYRRRGLARLAKLAALRRCVDGGIVRVTTGNDSTNVGMLAINDEVGFRPFAVETEWVKPLS